MTHVEISPASDASLPLLQLLLDLLLTSAAGRIFLSLSSAGVGASVGACPGLECHRSQYLSCHQNC